MDLILKYFPDITTTQKEHFNLLADLYKDWNEKINVISRKDIEHLYLKHVLHSLAIAKVIEFKKGSHILDVGTGGGFPGIPLAIMFPEVEFTLVDSIGKKINVVQEVAQALNLNNVTAKHCRVEDIKSKHDFIVSRAVTDMSVFYNWVRNKIKAKDIHTLSNGILYLKGGDLDNELKGFKTYEQIPISKYFKEDFFDTKKVIYIPI